ncbi:unnamed protein product [Hapterophycus canaliculatus]
MSMSSSLARHLGTYGIIFVCSGGYREGRGAEAEFGRLGVGRAASVSCGVIFREEAPWIVAVYASSLSPVCPVLYLVEEREGWRSLGHRSHLIGSLMLSARRAHFVVCSLLSPAYTTRGFISSLPSTVAAASATEPVDLSLLNLFAVKLQANRHVTHGRRSSDRRAVIVSV